MRVRNNRGAFGNHRLRKIRFGYRTATPHPRPAFFERPNDSFVAIHSTAEDRGDRRFRHVITRRSETSSCDDTIASLERFANRGADLLRGISCSCPPGNLYADRRELARKVRRVCVDGKSEQQLVADGDDFDLQGTSAGYHVAITRDIKNERINRQDDSSNHRYNPGESIEPGPAIPQSAVGPD